MLRNDPYLLQISATVNTHEAPRKGVLEELYGAGNLLLSSCARVDYFENRTHLGGDVEGKSILRLARDLSCATFDLSFVEGRRAIR